MTESLLKYFQLLYNPIHFPIQVINEEGKVVFVNEAFSFQWGYDLTELDEYSIFNDSELKKNNVLEIIREVFQKKNFKTITNYSDSLLINKEIVPPIFRTKIFHASFDNENFIILFHEDQTEMILAEAEVKKARENNKEAERLKNTFLTVLSHELRTPLNIVLGYASIIKDTMKDKISLEDMVYLDNLYSGSERLYNSITQMLEFAQIEAGNYIMNIQPNDLISVIKNSIDINSKSAVEKNINLKIRFKDEPIWVDVDLQSLENAVNNLISNAVTFNIMGFVEVEAGILEGKELAFCRIKDSGIGISPQYLDHLYQPFSQEDLNIGRNFEGNGLGLALAKRYLEHMGGSLLVDSIKGIGSTFTFTLPLSTKISMVAEKPAVSYAHSTKKILLIDDLSESYALLKAFTKSLYEIETCNFKNFDLKILEEVNPDIIAIDVNPTMWEKSINLCRNIQTNNMKKRKIIILSNEFVDDKIDELYNIGIDKFVVKPFSKSEILKAFEKNNF
jgi:signal transduction histidine kinase